MINIYNEEVFVDKTKIGDSFQSKQFAYIIVKKGILSLGYNEIKHDFLRGNIVLISTEIIYKIIGYTKDLEITIIAIDRDTLQNKVQFNFSRYEVYRLFTFDKENTRFIIQDEELEIILQLTRQIFIFSSKPLESTFRQEIILNIFMSLIYIIMAQLLESSDRAYTNLNSRKEEITMKFLQAISKDFKTQKELKFYADKLSISVKYLSNCVREITGHAPTGFLSASIINESKILLLNSQKTISVIADELGFSDQYSFGKFFKKHTGYSPRNFKVQNKLIETF